MESVIATRIGYLADKHSLLPGNHFGGLKEKSTVNALLTLQEKIYQTWRDKKVLSLVIFNSDLICSVINENKRAIAFIDDYTAWVTRPSMAGNVALLQAKIIPHLENWALSSEATFQVKKTWMVHFTWNKKRTGEAEADKPLIIGDQRILAHQEVKILGVILDSVLRYSNHIA